MLDNVTDGGRYRRLGIQRETQACSAADIAGGIGLPHLHRIAAFLRLEAVRPATAAIDAVLHAGTRLDAGKAQRAVVGDVVTGLAAVEGELHAGYRHLGVEREADAGVVGVAGHVGGAHGDMVCAFGGAEAADEGVAAVGAVADRGARFNAADAQGTVAGDAVGAAVAGVVGQRYGRGRRAGVEREAGAGGLGVAGDIGVGDADRVPAVGQRAGVVAAHDIAIDGDDAGGVAVGGVEGQRGVVGDRVGVVAAAVIGQ